MSTNYPQSADAKANVRLAGFRVDPAYLATIEDRLFAIGAETVRLRNQRHANAYIKADPDGATLPVGTVLAARVNAEVVAVPATSANLQSGAVVCGVLTQVAAPGAVVNVATAGVVDASTIGLSPGTKGILRANASTGLVERATALLATDVVVGFARADGTATIQVDSAGRRSKWFDVTAPEFGAIGNGNANDTVAIQAAVDAVIAVGGGTIFFPPGTYLSEGITLLNATLVQIVGHGAKINWTGSGPGGADPGEYIGFHLSGTCSDITIEGLWLNGSGTVDDDHAGVWCEVADSVANITVRNVKVTNCTNGIRFNSASVLDVKIEGCAVSTIVGELSGQGYGIAVGGGGNASHVKMIGNTVTNAQRHSFYVSACSVVSIVGNTSRNHRDGLSLGAFISPAFVIARSQDVTFAGNIIESSADYGLSIEPDSTAPSLKVRAVTVTGNSFLSNAYADIFIGTTVAGTTVVAEGVTIGNNVFRRAANAQPSIVVANGKRITIARNEFWADVQSAASLYTVIRCDGVGASSAKNDKIIIEDNTGIVSNDGNGAHHVYFVELAADVTQTDGVWVSIKNNRIQTTEAEPTGAGVGSALVKFDAVPTNTTLVVDGRGVYVVADATPSVANGVRYLDVHNTNPTTITNLDGGVEGQEVTLIFRDANTQIDRSNSVLSVAGNFTGAANSIIKLMKGNYPNFYWTETGRSVDT